MSMAVPNKAKKSIQTRHMENNMPNTKNKLKIFKALKKAEAHPQRTSRLTVIFSEAKEKPKDRGIIFLNAKGKSVIIELSTQQKYLHLRE